MANFDALDADGQVKTFKSTTLTGVETPHKNAQLLVSNAHVSNTNPVPVSLMQANVLISNANPIPVSLNMANAIISNTNPVPTSLMQANVLISNTNPIPVALAHANVVLSNTNSLPVSLCVANAVVSNTNAVPVRPTYPVWTTVWGVVGVPVANTDASSAPWSVTDAPTSGQKLVIDTIHLSAAAPVAVRFMCETSGTLVAGPYYMSGNSTLQIAVSNSKAWKLATADKKLQAQTAASGAISVLVGYHSEA